MENIDKFPNNKINEYKTKNSPEINELSPPSNSNNKIILNSENIEISDLDLNDNININNEKEKINEKRKINIFNFKDEEDEEKDEKDKKDIEDDNINKINLYEKENENEIFNNDYNNIKLSLLVNEIKLTKNKPLRITGIKTNINRKSMFQNNLKNSLFKNKNINSNLRKTLMSGNDYNKMKRISITNFNNNKNNNINNINININNFIRYKDMFLDDEIYLRAPGSFPDEEEKNYLLKLNFLDENNYLEEDKTNNEIIDKSCIRQTNSISYNSKQEKKIHCKFLMNNLPFEKIEEEDYKDEKNMNKKNNNFKDRISKVSIEIKNMYNDEDEMPGKNIGYDDNIKTNNNFEEGTFSKNLVNFENESKISFISINLFIKKIALFNFRINYPLLYKAFLQQYTIFLSPALFIEKIMQAFEFYYNKNNKITNELINLLNIVISENYEKIKEDSILLEKIKDFYTYLKEFIYTESKSGLEQDVDNIYYILFETDTEEDLDYSRRMVLQRKKSSSIFMKSKNLYSNIFTQIEKNKNKFKMKKKFFIRTKTDGNLYYRYFYIFSHDVMEIAQYLTCISYQLMRNISQKELLNKNFASKEKEKKSPNVMKVIDRFNKLILFIIEDIFSYDKKKERCQCIEKWIEIAIKLKELHNYNDLVMINTCFVNLTLKKLKLTFKKLSNKYKNIIKEMNAFCSSKECYINIRRLIFNNKGIPHIPYLGIILKEIINIEEMKYIMDENNINFNKLVKIFNVLDRFNDFKRTKFTFEKNKDLDILINLNPKTENELEDMVEQLEPKLKIFAPRGFRKRPTNTDKFYYDRKINTEKKK